jgi:ketosteroid isomerase-like protein
MNSDQKKELIRSTWQKMLVTGDLEGCLANMGEDVEWWICGSLPGIAGNMIGKDAVRKWFSSGTNVFPEGVTTEIRYFHDAGNTVIAEIRNRGKVSNGKIYDNYYCFVFELKRDKIHRIREYVDSYTVREAMGDLVH